MQRKNYLLDKYPKYKKGIAMIISIAFLIITAVLMSIMVKMTALTTKRTADVFFQEQAYLLAKSATEFALLAISAHDRDAHGCITNINIQYPTSGAQAIYDINTTIRYIGFNSYAGTCSTNSFIDEISTSESNGTVIIDTYVTTSTNVNITEPVRFHRRTMQKL